MRLPQRRKRSEFRAEETLLIALLATIGALEALVADVGAEGHVVVVGGGGVGNPAPIYLSSVEVKAATIELLATLNRLLELYAFGVVGFDLMDSSFR